MDFVLEVGGSEHQRLHLHWVLDEPHEEWLTCAIGGEEMSEKILGISALEVVLDPSVVALEGVAPPFLIVAVAFAFDDLEHLLLTFWRIVSLEVVEVHEHLGYPSLPLIIQLIDRHKRMNLQLLPPAALLLYLQAILEHEPDSLWVL